MSFISNAQENLENFWDDNSNTILTVGALIGFGASLYFTARGAIRADRKVQKLEKEKADKKEELRTIDIVKTVAPECIPTLVSAAFTIACIISNRNINEQDKIAMCGAYAMVGRSYERYRNKVKEVAGEDIAKKIDIAMAEDVRIHQIGGAYQCDDALQDIDSGAGECVFFEPISELYFASTPEKVRQAEYYLNRNMSLRGDVSLWEFYKFLGIENFVYNNRRHRRALKKLGWDVDFMMLEYEQTWIDFEHEYVEINNEKDEPSGYFIIAPLIMPRDLSEDYPMMYNEDK